MPNRIEREIEEILTRLDEFVPDEPRTSRAKRRANSALAETTTRVRGRFSRVTGGHIVLAAALMLVATMLIPLPPTLERWLVIGSVAVLFGSIILSIKPLRRRTPANRYWRGQVLEMRRLGPLTRLRMWWRRQRNRRR